MCGIAEQQTNECRWRWHFSNGKIRFDEKETENVLVNMWRGKNLFDWKKKKKENCFDFVSLFFSVHTQGRKMWLKFSVLLCLKFQYLPSILWCPFSIRFIIYDENIHQNSKIVFFFYLSICLLDIVLFSATSFCICLGNFSVSLLLQMFYEADGNQAAKTRIVARYKCWINRKSSSKL